MNPFQSWTLIAEVFQAYFSTIHFDEHAKEIFQQIFEDNDLEHFLSFRTHLYSTLIADPVPLDKHFTYNNEHSYYTITGDNIIKLYLDWKIIRMVHQGMQDLGIGPQYQ